MKWIVGLDLRARSRGAILTAAWLGRTAQPGASWRFVGVHVIPSPRSGAVRDDVVDELCNSGQQEARAAVERGGAASFIDRIDVVPGGQPEQTLAAACTYHHADGVIVGRYAKRDRGGLLRLGQVARRLVRQLPVPVMVVPPDYDDDVRGTGPVVVATDLEPDAVAAARFGLKLAADLQRDLILLHASGYIQHASGTEAQAYGSPGEPAIERWARQYGCGGATGLVTYGDPVDSMLNVADSLNASALVCGSRHLSAGQRVFRSSTGTELARHARCPVVVVPPRAIVQVVG